MEKRFDPMTGEPINNTRQETWNFDPKTGEPINNTRHEAGNTDLNTGECAGREEKFAGWVPAIFILIIAIAVGAFAGVKSGIFMSGSQKVLLATYNTLNDSNTFVEALQPLSVLIEEQYTVSMDLDMEDTLSISAELASTDKQKQLSGSVRFLRFISVDFNAGVTSEEVQFQAPALDRRLFVYNYKDKKTGYMANALTDQEIESIDSLCEMIASGNSQQEQIEELVNIFYDAYKELEFESVSSAEYEIDGKNCTCKGYVTTIQSQNIRSFLSDLEDFVDDCHVEVLESYYYYTVSEFFGEMDRQLDYMPDYHVTIYVYENKLACIMIEAEGESMEIIFHGGDSRMQNIEIIDSDGDTVLAITGEIEDSVETLVLEMNEKVYGYLNYDSETGEFLFGDILDAVLLNGTLESDKKSLEFTITNYWGEVADMDLSLSLSQGASVEELSGEKFDVGDASEAELQALVEEFETLLSSLPY